jgi:hypothetical protein
VAADAGVAGIGGETFYLSGRKRTFDPGTRKGYDMRFDIGNDPTEGGLGWARTPIGY